MELLNVYAITSDGTKVEASANTVGAVPQGQIATKDKAGLFKIGENKYKFSIGINDDATMGWYQLFVLTNNNNAWYDTDRLVWMSTDELKAEMKSSSDDTGTVTNAVCAIEGYNGNKCIKVTYTLNGEVKTGYVDSNTGETEGKTWVQVDDKGQAYVETQSVDIATTWSTGTVMPNANNFTIDSSSGDLQLKLATDTTRGGIKVEKTDVSGAVELTLIQFGSGDGYTCLMVFPKLDVDFDGQSGLIINSMSYENDMIVDRDPSDFSCIFLNGGQRKTVRKWWFDSNTIVWEDCEDDTQYQLTDYSITSVQHVKVYRMYRFQAYDSDNSIAYNLDILAGLDQETCSSDQEISDYVCKVDVNMPSGDGKYAYYLWNDGSYHPNILQYTRGAQGGSFDTSWLCCLWTSAEGIVKGSLPDLIEDRAGSSGEYLIKNDSVTGGGYKFYLYNIDASVMPVTAYLDNTFHDYAEYAEFARKFSGTVTENRVILNDKEQPIVDIDNLNIASKVQTIIDNYHTPKIASNSGLGHVLVGNNTTGYVVDDLVYTDITGDAEGYVAQYVGTVSDMTAGTYVITAKCKTKHSGICKEGYFWDIADSSEWSTSVDQGSDAVTVDVMFSTFQVFSVVRINLTHTASAMTFTLGSIVSEDGTKRYVDVDDSGVMSYLIPPAEKVELPDVATHEKLGLVKFGNGYYRFELRQDVDGDYWFNTTPLIAYTKIQSPLFEKIEYPTIKKYIIAFHGDKPYMDTGSFTLVDSSKTVTAVEQIEWEYNGETVWGVKISISDGTTAYLSKVAGQGEDLVNHPVVNNGANQMQVWIGSATEDVRGLVKSSTADAVNDTYYVKVDTDGTMNVTVPNPEATDTTLGTVQYGHNGYKYYAYVNDASTEVVLIKKIAEVTTNILHTSFDASTKEATWLQTKPTFTFHEIPNSGYTINSVTIVQSGTSAIKVFKFSIAYTDSNGNTGTTILKATGNETCTYGMVNKSSETGQMMTDMTFLPDFIVAEMKKHTESWTFTLEDDSTITHNVVVLDD